MVAFHRSTPSWLPAAAVLICGYLVVPGWHSATHAIDAKERAAILLEADEFWEVEGRLSKHALGDAATKEIQRLATDTAASPKVRLRANKLSTDFAGNTRVNERIPPEKFSRAMLVAMKHVEEHLTDENVRKFSPENGITHITIADLTDEGVYVVLVESVDQRRNGGLNVKVDPAVWKVTHVQQWGKDNSHVDQKKP